MVLGSLRLTAGCKWNWVLPLLYTSANALLEVCSCKTINKALYCSTRISDNCMYNVVRDSLVSCLLAQFKIFNEDQWHFFGVRLTDF